MKLRKSIIETQRILTFIVVVLSMATVAAAEWTSFNGDPAGHRHQPNGSSVSTGTRLQVEGTLPFGYCRTGDVDGDGLIETVGTSGDTLTILDHNGQLQSSATMPTPGYLAALCDFDGDGVLDIGVGTPSDWLPTNTAFAYIYSGDTTLQTTVSRDIGSDSHFRPVGIDRSGNIIILGHSGYSKNYRGFLGYDYETGVQAWEYGLGMARYPSFADIDNDGNEEWTVGWGTLHNGHSVNGTDDGQHYLTVFDDDGTNIVSQPYPTHTDGTANHRFTDLDHDGVYEILAIEGHGPTYYHGTNRVHLYDTAGNLLKSYDGPYDEGWADGYSICDIDGDGNDNIIIGNLSVLTILDENLDPVRSISNSGLVQLTCDLTGDGHFEIVTLSEAGMLNVFDSQLNLIDSLALGSDYPGHFSLAEDYDSDGTVELLIYGTSGDFAVASLVPEPATMSLLALGGVAILKKRRGK